MVSCLDEAMIAIRCVIVSLEEGGYSIPELIEMETQLGEFVAILKELKNVEFFDRRTANLS